MSAYELETTTPAFDSLRSAIDELSALSRADRVHLVALGKAYQALAEAMTGIADEAGRPSVRFRAVNKALDLTTKKSMLNAFVSA